jgi:AcrR family transcriptional regulator
MRTARTAHLDRSAADLTGRARIRDAAIDCFTAEGFGASVRTIAERAGVSPGLITHHFGSKDALRTACDTEVLQRYHQLKDEAVADPSGHLLAHLAVPGPAATVLVYLLRAIHAGGAPAQAFLDRLAEHVRPVMADAVASGLVRPSRDEEARGRYLTEQTMGGMLVHFLLAPDQTPDAFVASLHERQRDTILPTLELYTEGLLTDRSMLDEYVAHRQRSAAPSA